jgi:hypothetical protein
MRKQTFKAQIARLLQRWPFSSTEEGATAREEFIAELWAEVEPWTGEKAKSFSNAVADLVGSITQYALPGTVAIVARAHSIQFKKSTKRSEDARLTDLLCQLRGHVLEGYLSLESKIDTVATSLRCGKSDAILLWARVFFWRPCPGCQFGIALAEGVTDDLVHWWCPSCKAKTTGPVGEKHTGVEYED